jgi:hypothetical protein
MINKQTIKKKTTTSLARSENKTAALLKAQVSEYYVTSTGKYKNVYTDASK